MQQGDLGIDYSFARPDLASLPQEIRFIARYGSHTPAKNISGLEAAGIILGGRELHLVWETTATRVLVGHDGGVADGAAAGAIGAGVGYTGQWDWAVDFDLQPGDYDVAEAYGHGFAEGLGVGIESTGPYGGFFFVEEMLNRGFGRAWQTVAWSRGNVSTRANIYQRLVPIHPIPGTDENVALQTDGVSTPPGQVPDTPQNNAVPEQIGSDGQRNLFVMHPFITGDDVGAQQEFLTSALNIPITHDNVYGPQTAEAVTLFQSGCGLVADGIVGPATRQKEADIIAWVSSLPAGEVQSVPEFPGYARFRDTSDAVAAFQQRLNDRGYDVGPYGADSKFGMDTLNAMTAFQRDAGIRDDGVGGPITWTHLWT